MSETFLLSLRNAFRQRSRLSMTLGLLAAGGAMFMTALNISDAWDDNLKRIYEQRLYDLEVKLNNSIASDTLLSKINSIPGVRAAEAWSYFPTSFSKGTSRNVANTYPDKGHGSFTLLALPGSSRLLNPTLMEGVWLNAREPYGVVLNQLARSFPELRIGDSVRLSANGTTLSWIVIGFTEDVGSPATAYVSTEAFSKRSETVGRANMLRIAFTDRERTFAKSKTVVVEALLDRENVSVNSSVPVWILHNAVAGHMKVLINALMAMAVLMALVGTLGLMSTMSMNVMERTREIGVMRAIGATPAKIRNLIVWEGFIISALSLLLALIASLLLSTFLGRFIGNLAFRTPLSLTISWLAMGGWIGIMLLGSYFATRLPARRANTITTREALAYE